MKKTRKSSHWYNVHDKDVGGFVLDGHGDLVHDGGLYPDALTDPRMRDVYLASRLWACK